MLLAAVVLALTFGGYRAATDGRFRGTHRVKTPATMGEPAPVEPVETPWTHIAEAVPGVELGEHATLVQFSSAFCAPCRATRRILTDLAAVTPGVVHLEIDAEHHLDLVRRLGILRTPTTLILDPDGHEVTRAAGAPRKEQVLAALSSIDRRGFRSSPS